MMRLLVILIMLGCAFPAQAYIDDTDADEAAATAGEQNTNLHRLTDIGNNKLKDLKKRDEYIRRAEAAGQVISASAFDDLDDFAHRDEVQMHIKRTLSDVGKRVKDPSLLRLKTENEVYVLLAQIEAKQIRDAEVAEKLSNSIRRKRP